MRTRVVAVLSGLMLCHAPANAADGSPVLVIPGRPDVPVIVNRYGFDASYTVVEGDFGLDRPAQVDPRIIAGPRVIPAPVAGGYFSQDRTPARLRPLRDPAVARPATAGAGAELSAFLVHAIRSRSRVDGSALSDRDNGRSIRSRGATAFSSASRSVKLDAARGENHGEK